MITAAFMTLKQLSELSVPSEIRNAKIKRTFLGREDHGILTAYIVLEGDAWGTVYGGMMTSHLGNWVDCVTRLLGCTWEELPGKLVRCAFSRNHVVFIGHPIDDKWFCQLEETK